MKASHAAVAAALALLAAPLLGAAALAQVAIIPAPPPPLVKLPPGEASIRLEAMEVRVVVNGLEAETVTTLTFRNPNARQLAGDLEFPLPDGAAVAGFALDVGGRMVDGVVVTREKARVVLETEMRRRVDPGIVEHVRGNLFRTRIFPLPPGGTRTVRVTAVAPLALSGGDAAVPVLLPRVAIPALVLRVEVAKGPVRPQLGGFGNLSLTEWDDKWTAEATLANVTPGDDLYVRLPKLPDLVTAVEEFEGERYLAINHAPRLPGRAAAPRVDRVAVAWDASGSRSPEAVRRDRELLAALLANPGWKDCTVDLVVFRDRPERPRSFAVRKGKAGELLAHLAALPYDGGTDLAALDLRRESSPNRGTAAWLLFTDGLHTLGKGLPRFGGLPVHVVASDPVRDAGLQRFLAAATGGALVDLAVLEPEAGAALVADPPPALLRVDATGGALQEVQYRFDPGSGRATVHARLTGAGEATLVYGAGGREVLRVPVRLPAGRVATGRLLARAWAARRVEELSVFPEENEEEMTGLGRRYGLVTPNTSLIVLESLAQYLEHRIEPPASWPEMRAQYLAALKGREEEAGRGRAAKIERVLGWWRERVAWWEREFEYPKHAGWRLDLDARREAMPSTSPRGAAAAPPGPAGLEERRMAAREAPAATGAPAPQLMMSRAADIPLAVGAAQREAKGAAWADGSVAASIAIAAWKPDAPYLRAIKARPAEEAYAAYLAERSVHTASPSFFLDCAGYLLGVDRALGVRVLSNLAELRIDDAALLRVLAWRLAEAGELDRAVEVLEKVRGLRPEDPQSHRDLALLLADRMDRDRAPADGVRAARLLNDVVLGTWARFEQIEVIALMELNRLLARLERLDPAAVATVDFVDGRLRRLLDVDLRIVLSWDVDNTDIDLHVVEPSGEEAFYGHSLTTIGGRVSRDFTQGYGPEEYAVRRALPGVYRIRCKYYGSSQQTLTGPATVTATAITNFGRPDERRQTLTLRLDKVHDMVDIGAITVGAGDLPARAAAALTRAMVEALGRGVSRTEVELALGAPDRVDGGGVAVLVYHLADGTLVRLGFGPGLLWAREAHRGAERELRLQ